MTLNVIHCNDLTVIMLRMYKAAAVLSALMKLCAVPCHDRGHINVMLVLQSCTDPLYILPGSSSEKYAASSDGSCSSSNIEVEVDVDVIEGFTAMNKEVNVGIKQEEFPEDLNCFGIKSNVVSSSVYVSVSRHLLPLSRNISYFFVMSVFLSN